MKQLKLIPLFTALILAACSDTPPAPEPTKPEAAAKPSTPAPFVPKAPTVDKVVPAGKITSIDMGQLFTLLQTDKVYLFDTRPPLYFRLGHIDGANSFPLIKYDNVLPAKRAELDAARKAGKLIVGYCQNVNCPDAHKVATKLSRLGYDVSIYSGGWEEWKRSGLQP